MHEFIGTPSAKHLEDIERFRQKQAFTDFKSLTTKMTDLNNEFKKHLPPKEDAFIFEIKDSKPIAIVPLADLHLGATGVQYEKLLHDLEIITSTKGMYSVCIGDWLNNFIFAKLMVASWGDVRPKYQWVLCRLVIQALAKTLIQINPGNHEHWTAKVSDIDEFQDIAEKANVLYSGNKKLGKVTVKFNNLDYKGVFRHKPIGSSRINPMLGAKNIYRDLTSYDFCITAHTHTFGIEHFYKHEQIRVAMNCGSYKTDDAFADECGFPDAIPKMPVIILMPDKREMLTFENIETAAMILKGLRGDE
jgi:hypothetical protein